jgi:hypothetical protein
MVLGFQLTCALAQIAYTTFNLVMIKLLINITPTLACPAFD